MQAEAKAQEEAEEVEENLVPEEDQNYSNEEFAAEDDAIFAYSRGTPLHICLSSKMPVGASVETADITQVSLITNLLESIKSGTEWKKTKGSDNILLENADRFQKIVISKYLDKNDKSKSPLTFKIKMTLGGKKVAAGNIEIP